MCYIFLKKLIKNVKEGNETVIIRNRGTLIYYLWVL